jgi:hypothetical protein
MAHPPKTPWIRPGLRPLKLPCGLPSMSSTGLARIYLREIRISRDRIGCQSYGEAAEGGWPDIVSELFVRVVKN